MDSLITFEWIYEIITIHTYIYIIHQSEMLIKNNLFTLILIRIRMIYFFVLIHQKLLRNYLERIIKVWMLFIRHRKVFENKEEKQGCRESYFIAYCLVSNVGIFVTTFRGGNALILVTISIETIPKSFLRSNYCILYVYIKHLFEHILHKII